MNASTVDAKLDSATIAQFSFKCGTVRLVAAAVAKAFAESQSDFVWTDEVALPELAAEDKNVIGLVFRNMARWGMIRRLEGAGDHRRSRREGRKGGIVFRYVLANRGLLKTFMERNGVGLPEVRTQRELL